MKRMGLTREMPSPLTLTLKAYKDILMVTTDMQVLRKLFPADNEVGRRKQCRRHSKVWEQAS
jgi:hypothetical protein